MPDKSPAITLLRWIGRLLPGDYLKTTWYLTCVAKPRRALRTALSGFYRMEHIYDVLTEVKNSYGGSFSILEFGTNEGYAFTKILYATKYLGMANRVTVHAFDSFQGMPSPSDRRDINIITNDPEWVAGQFRGAYEDLVAYCQRRYGNYRIHRGYFHETLTQQLLDSLRTDLPILIWIDCDFYSSARAVLEPLIPCIPSGCVVYFDEYEWNYGSHFTGEARIVHEINQGVLGDGIELVLDERLALDSRRVYRFVRFEGGPHYPRLAPAVRDPGRPRTNDSPLP